MAIKDWPEQLRPREKLLQQGAQHLTDAELLAIFLRTGVTGTDAVTLAQQLLEHFGSLPALLSADLATFTQAKGLGQAKYVQLQAVLEMARRYFEQQLRSGVDFHRPEQVAAFLRHLFSEPEREYFVVLYLNSQHQLLEHEVLFKGTVNESAVYPREVARQALLKNATALIVAHNHPGGTCQPSDADLQLTALLAKTLQLLDIHLLDHLILSRYTHHWLSLRQHQPHLFSARHM